MPVSNRTPKGFIFCALAVVSALVLPIAMCAAAAHGKPLPESTVLVCAYIHIRALNLAAGAPNENAIGAIICTIARHFGKPHLEQ